MCLSDLPCCAASACRSSRRCRDAQQLIAVTLDPPPPQIPAPPDTEPEREVARPKDAEGAASPANRKDTPTEVVAPPPEIRLPPPPSIADRADRRPGQRAGGGRGGAAGSRDRRGRGRDRARQRPRSAAAPAAGGGGRGVGARYLSGGIDPRGLSAPRGRRGGRRARPICASPSCPTAAFAIAS